jgi:hypothetical protein
MSRFFAELPGFGTSITEKCAVSPSRIREWNTTNRRNFRNPLGPAVAYKDVRGRAKQDARAVLSCGMTVNKRFEPNTHRPNPRGHVTIFRRATRFQHINHRKMCRVPIEDTRMEHYYRKAIARSPRTGRTPQQAIARYRPMTMTKPSGGLTGLFSRSEQKLEISVSSSVKRCRVRPESIPAIRTSSSRYMKL